LGYDVIASYDIETAGVRNLSGALGHPPPAGDAFKNLRTRSTVKGNDDGEFEFVFWQVSGLVALATTAHLEGVVLTQTSVTLLTGASVNGRLLAQTAVNIDSSTVVQPAPYPQTNIAKPEQGMIARPNLHLRDETASIFSIRSAREAKRPIRGTYVRHIQYRLDSPSIKAYCLKQMFVEHGRLGPM
jgi:hypothetical protein